MQAIKKVLNQLKLLITVFFGINIFNSCQRIINIPVFLKDLIRYVVLNKSNKSFKLCSGKICPVLLEENKSAGATLSHYFYQD